MSLLTNRTHNTTTTHNDTTTRRHTTYRLFGFGQQGFELRDGQGLGGGELPLLDKLVLAVGDASLSGQLGRGGVERLLPPGVELGQLGFQPAAEAVDQRRPERGIDHDGERRRGARQQSPTRR